MDNNLKKLREFLLNYTRTREKNYSYGNGVQSMRKLNAITKIRRGLDYLQGQSLRCHCQWILNERKAILEIIPSRTSRFQKLRNQVHQLLEYAHQYLKVTELV